MHSYSLKSLEHVWKLVDSLNKYEASFFKVSNKRIVG
jgi:hypothetical protein